MPDRIEGFDIETRPPDEVFAAVGDATRVDVLRALADAGEPVPFSTLQKAVGVSDSGRFNYHLGTLTDHLVRKTEEGYELRHAGRAIVQAIRRGSVTTDPVIEPRLIDLPCPFCGADQEFSYADETVRLRCSACPGAIDDPYDRGTIMVYDLPASALANRTELEVSRVAHRLYDAEIVAMTGGACPECAGRVEGEISCCRDHDPAANGICPACHTRYLAWTTYRCVNCDHARRFPSWFEAWLHPDLVAFARRVAGVTDPLPFPKLLSAEGPDFRNVTEAVTADDPPTVEVTFKLAEETWTAILEDGSSIEVRDAGPKRV